MAWYNSPMMNEKEDSMTLDQQIAQAEAQLEIYEIEHHNSTSHQYSAAIESLYIEALQQYGALLARHHGMRRLRNG